MSDADAEHVCAVCDRPRSEHKRVHASTTLLFCRGGAPGKPGWHEPFEGEPQYVPQPPDSKIVYDYTLWNDGERVMLRVGDELRVTLPTHTSSGYQWALGPYERRLLVQGPHYYQPGTTGVYGALASEIWRFVGASPGHCRLSFVERRPWLPQPQYEPLDRFDLQVMVRDA